MRLVGIKSSTALFPIPAGFNVFNKKRAWAVLIFSELSVKYLKDVQQGIKADKIG